MRLLSLFTLLLTVSTGFAQDHAYTYTAFQTRNSDQQWGSAQNIGIAKARISESQIRVRTDRDYALTILSHTDLPDHGVIYLCEDEHKKPVTVTLIEGDKMYVYCEAKRFLINFDALAMRQSMADSD